MHAVPRAEVRPGPGGGLEVRSRGWVVFPVAPLSGDGRLPGGQIRGQVVRQPEGPVGSGHPAPRSAGAGWRDMVPLGLKFMALGPRSAPQWQQKSRGPWLPVVAADYDPLWSKRQNLFGQVGDRHCPGIIRTVHPMPVRKIS
jgi:hypothetical protein